MLSRELKRGELTFLTLKLIRNPIQIITHRENYCLPGKKNLSSKMRQAGIDPLLQELSVTFLEKNLKAGDNRSRTARKRREAQWRKMSRCPRGVFAVP